MSKKMQIAAISLKAKLNLECVPVVFAGIETVPGRKKSILE